MESIEKAKVKQNRTWENKQISGKLINLLKEMEANEAGGDHRAGSESDWMDRGKVG